MVKTSAPHNRGGRSWLADPEIWCCSVASTWRSCYVIRLLMDGSGLDPLKPAVCRRISISELWLFECFSHTSGALTVELDVMAWTPKIQRS